MHPSQRPRDSGAGRAWLLAGPVAAVLFLAVGGPRAILSPAAEGEDPDALSPRLQNRVDRVFSDLDRSDSPGCALGIVREGELVYTRGYGMADLQHGIPITPSSVFHVASVSKQFTALALLLLERDGALALDDEVRSRVGELPDFGVPITFRHLIHHTSGLRDQWGLLALAGWRTEDPKSQEDILWLVSRQEDLNFRPGEEHLYSNTGYTLMAVAVERTSGRSFREFTRARIFEPLGMEDTDFQDAYRRVVPGRTSAYVPTGREGEGRFLISIPTYDNVGATSLFTTVEDLARWDANFHDPRVGDAELLEAMHAPGRLNGGREVGYAFGLTHGSYRGLRTVSHGGADAGYRTDFLRFPDEGYTFITLCNLGTVNAGTRNRQVADVILAPRFRSERRGGDARTTAPPGAVEQDGPGLTGAAPPVPLRVGPEPAAPASLADFQGRFRSEELDVTWTIALEEEGLRVYRRRMGSATLEPVFEDGFRGREGVLAFSRDGDGKVTGFLLNTTRIRHLRFRRVE